MLEKAKNRKIFYFFILIVLSLSFLTFPVLGITEIFEHTTSGTLYYGGYGSSYTWSAIHNAASATSEDTSNIQPYLRAASTTNYWMTMGRGYLIFNTSSLPDSIEITDAYIIFENAIQKWTGLGNSNVTLVYFNTASPTNPSTADYNDFGTNIIGQKLLSTWTTGGDYWQQIDIDDYSVISQTGYTQLGLRLDDDLYNSPGWASGKVYTGITIANSVSGQTIKLYVTYNEVSEAPEAIIESDKTSGSTPLTVTFNDDSINFNESEPYPIYTLTTGDGASYSGERIYPGQSWIHTYNAPGTYEVNYTITQNGTAYTDLLNITVGAYVDNYNVIVSGLNGEYILNATISIWYNGEDKGSELTDISGNAYFTIPPYRFVNGTVTKSGYQTASFDTYIYPENNFELVTLYLNNETIPGGDVYGSYIVTFKNALTNELIPNINVKVYSDNTYTSLIYDEYSNSAGLWHGAHTMNYTYYYRTSETTSYYSYSWNNNLTSSPTYRTVYLVPKTMPTATITPNPMITYEEEIVIPTYTYNEGNISTLNVKERMTNLLVLAGFGNADNIDLIFAMIIILGCTCLVGWITLSGSGAGMGSIIGFVASLGLGLIPLWILIAAFFLGSLYIALKLFGGGSGE
jgi:hypothetical protein